MRPRVLAASRDDHLSYRAVAARFRVGESTVRLWLRRRCEGGAAADTDVLVACTRHVLRPVLRPGQVVVLDNVSANKAPAIRALVERAGCTLRFLQPYSPDLNPLEAAWSTLTTRLRGVGARSVEALNAMSLTPYVDAALATAGNVPGRQRLAGSVDRL